MNLVCFVQQTASPSSSELSSDMERLLQLKNDEDDDATSKAAPTPSEMDQQPYNYDHPENSAYQVILCRQFRVSQKAHVVPDLQLGFVHTKN